MDGIKKEQLAIVKFLSKEGYGPKQIYDRLETIYGNNALSMEEIFKWNCSCFGLNDNIKIDYLS